MKKARRTEEQIIGILQEHDAGAKCADLCRKHGMSEGTYYAWKAKYGGMTGRCCRTQSVEDSHRESMRLDVSDDQAPMRPLPDDELEVLQ